MIKSTVGAGSVISPEVSGVDTDRKKLDDLVVAVIFKCPREQFICVYSYITPSSPFSGY